MGVNKDLYKKMLFDLGTKLRSARLENKISMNEVSRRTGLTAEQVRKIENGASNFGIISLLAYLKHTDTIGFNIISKAGDKSFPGIIEIDFTKVD